MPSYAPWYDYAIAAAYNNASGLKRIETIIPSGESKAFPPVNAYSAYNPGTLRLRADGLAYITGYASTEWRFSYLSVVHYRYLISTYSTGGNSYAGKVTIRTRIADGTFANYNAIMLLPILPKLNRTYLKYRDVVIRFTRLATPS